MNILLAMIVWYFPGWLRTQEVQEGVVPALEATFPGAEVVFKSWDGDTLWPLATKHADEAADKFVAEIAALPPEKRDELVLVGHSLGGRIVTRVASRLGAKGLAVREVVLMGAAIPLKDQEVSGVGKGSRLPVLAICNPQDVTLRYVYAALGLEWSAAFGANGAVEKLANVTEVVVPTSLVKETPIDSVWGKSEKLKEIANHHALFYLACLKKTIEGEPLPKEDMVVQDFITVEAPVMDREIWWDVLDTRNGWKLERNKVTGHARILDPKKIRRAWGTVPNMTAAFAKLAASSRSVGGRCLARGLFEGSDEEGGVAVAAAGGDLGEREVRSVEELLRGGDAAAGDLGPRAASEFGCKKPIQADARDLQGGGDLRGTEGT